MADETTLQKSPKGGARAGGRSKPRQVKVVAPTELLAGQTAADSTNPALVAKKPTVSPQGGSYGTSILVTMVTETPNADIRYTLDGSNPELGSTLYTGPVPVATSLTLRARTFRKDLVTSGDDTEQYVISVTGTFLALEDASHFILEDGLSRIILEAA